MGLLPHAHTYVDRFGRTALIFGGVWPVAVIVYSLTALRAQFEYAAGVDARLTWAAPATLVLAAVLASFWAWFRRRGMWCYEPAAIAGGAIAACLLREPLGTLVAGAIFVVAFALGGAVLQRCGFERTWVRGSGDPLRSADPGQSAGSREVLGRVPLSITLLRTGSGASFQNPVEEIVFSAGAGFGLMSSALFLIGLAGVLAPLPLGALLIVAALACRRHIRGLADCVSQINRSWVHCKELRTPLIGLTIPFTALFVVFGLLVSLAPSIAVDAMRDHLADVARFLISGDVSAVPVIRYSYHPKANEVLLTLASALGDEPAARLLNPGFFLLTLLAAFAVGRVSGVGRTGAMLGVLVLATMPFLHWTGSVVKNDLQLVFLQMGSLLAYFRSRQQDERRWLMLGVFLLACGISVKHTAAFVALPIGLLYLAASWRRPRLLAQLALISILFGAHWHALTFARTGSPIYPWRAGGTVSQWPALGTKPRPPLWQAYATYPWLGHFEGGALFQSPTPNPMGLFLVLACPIWLLTRRTKPTFELECLFVCGLCYVWWGYVWGVLRYAIPMVILLAMLTAGRLSGYLTQRSARFDGIALNRIVHCALLYALCFAVLPTVFMEINFPQIRYFAGQLDRRGYLDEAVRFMPSIRYLESVWTPGELALSLGNPAVAHSPDPSRFHFTEAFGRYLERTRIRLAENRYQYDYVLGPERSQARILALFERTTVVYSDGSYFVARTR